MFNVLIKAGFLPYNVFGFFKLELYGITVEGIT